MNELVKRIEILEHLVNDVIIGGLKKANDEYIDEDNFGKFKESYGPMLEPYSAPMVAMCGEGYDLTRDLYDFTKSQDGYGSEDFDEKRIVEDAIENIKSKIAAVKGTDPDNVEVKAEVEVAGDKAEADTEDKEKMADEAKEDKEETIEEQVDEEEIPSEEQLAKELKAALES